MQTNCHSHVWTPEKHCATLSRLGAPDFRVVRPKFPRINFQLANASAAADILLSPACTATPR
eukprot:scaffold491_cov188-Pinguiococcus_pyrenoidosus.AAC.4